MSCIVAFFWLCVFTLARSSTLCSSSITFGLTGMRSNASEWNVPTLQAAKAGSLSASLCFNSSAALRENVAIAIACGASPWLTSLAVRSTRTVVLPAPGAATRSRLPDLELTAACCSSVSMDLAFHFLYAMMKVHGIAYCWSSIFGLVCEMFFKPFINHLVIHKLRSRRPVTH